MPELYILHAIKKGTTRPYKILYCVLHHNKKYITSTYMAFLHSALHDGNTDPLFFCQEGQRVEGDILIAEHPPKTNGRNTWKRSKTAYIGPIDEEAMEQYILTRFPTLYAWASLGSELGDQELWNKESAGISFNVSTKTKKGPENENTET